MITAFDACPSFMPPEMFSSAPPLISSTMADRLPTPLSIYSEFSVFFFLPYIFI
jgi:hypothetical protein